MAENSPGDRPLNLTINLAVNVPNDSIKILPIATPTSAGRQSPPPVVKEGFDHRAKDAFDIAKGPKPKDARGLLANEFRKAAPAKLAPNLTTQILGKPKGQSR